jgi:hypothetical protein
MLREGNNSENKESTQQARLRGLVPNACLIDRSPIQEKASSRSWWWHWLE